MLLRRQQQSRALVSLCVGVGQGVAWPGSGPELLRETNKRSWLAAAKGNRIAVCARLRVKRQNVNQPVCTNRAELRNPSGTGHDLFEAAHVAGGERAQAAINHSQACGKTIIE